MLNAPLTPGRHAALRERHHRAIIDAAAALLDENGADGFTVDALAVRAGVSRRTVFNHFATIDDIVIAVCSEVLGSIVARFEALAAAQRPVAPAESESAALFDEVAHALRESDLVGPMARLTEILGSAQDEPTPRQAMLLLRAFTGVSETLATHILARHESADALSVNLLVGSLMSGLVVLHRDWYAATGGADDEASRRVWSALLDRLIHLTGDGFRSHRPDSPAPPTVTPSLPRRSPRG